MLAAPASMGSPNLQGNNAASQKRIEGGKKDEQREFIMRFITRYIEESSGSSIGSGRAGYPPVTRSEQQEMESVLYSVSFGKQEINKKVTYQAFSAAISSQSHVDLVLKYIC